MEFLKDRTIQLMLTVMALLIAVLIYIQVNNQSKASVTAEDTTIKQEETVTDATESGTEPAATEEEEEPENVDEIPQIRISEVMFKNHATNRDQDGDFSDWIELINDSDEAVSLSGWSLSRNDQPDWKFPDVTLESGQYLIVFASGKDKNDEELHTGFTLSGDGEVNLFTRRGTLVDTMQSVIDKADVSTVRTERETIASYYPTPGFSNDESGYVQYSNQQSPTAELQISELMTDNSKYERLSDVGCCDWVEIVNRSDHRIQLSDYYLSDSRNDLTKWQFPEQLLEPGEMMLVFCSGDEANTTKRHAHTNFALSANGEAVYLTKKDGTVVDYVYAHDIPKNCSLGRSGRENGWFYFAEPTPEAENTGRTYRKVLATPRTLEADGVFNDVESVLVTLTGEGTIYYTTDGTKPSESSIQYTGPFELKKTTILQAIAVKEDCLNSEMATFSYIVNENHVLPVISLVADNIGDFRNLWGNNIRTQYIQGSISYYGLEGDGFSSRCGIRLKGWTSLENPKKSLGVSFSKAYSRTKLEYDVFGNGVDVYEDLSIRAGQDYPLSIIKNELCQELALEMGEDCVTQHSIYAILYVNGKYYGIYTLKEDINRAFYASTQGVSKDSITQARAIFGRDSEIYKDVLGFALTADMTDPENYEYFCSKFDINSLIDWLIIEGYSANTDVTRNVRCFKSTEGDGKWRVAFYDLDWTLKSTDSAINNVFNNKSSNNNLVRAVRNLVKSDLFVEAVATRYAELTQTILSNDHVVEKIHELSDLIEPEVQRERMRWDGSYDSWVRRVNQLIRFIEENDYETFTEKKLAKALGLTEEERMVYFGF